MKEGTTIYKNGAVVRWKNRRVSFGERENGDVWIEFDIVDHEHADGAACAHESFRGKVRRTSIGLSEAAMQALIGSYLQYQNWKAKEFRNEENFGKSPE